MLRFTQARILYSKGACTPKWLSQAVSSLDDIENPAMLNHYDEKNVFRQSVTCKCTLQPMPIIHEAGVTILVHTQHGQAMNRLHDHAHECNFGENGF